jgi:hypothetical protein
MTKILKFPEICHQKKDEPDEPDERKEVYIIDKDDLDQHFMRNAMMSYELEQIHDELSQQMTRFDRIKLNKEIVKRIKTILDRN